ncbi:MAG: efflux RND transporter permease subunit [Planctomycetes bacterium]|nr:efflux RND transporter permease subunit [Planctomycetota bacterium]
MTLLYDTQQAIAGHPVLAFFARRPITVTTLLFTAAVLGAISLKMLPLELFPAGFEPRSISVDAPYSRAGDTVSPMTVERELTLPIEAELSTIPGVKDLTATSSRTGANFNLDFDGSADMDAAYAEVMAAVERARLRLPSETGRIRVRRFRGGSNNFPLAFVNFAWKPMVQDPHLKLERQIQPALEALDGVASVTFSGTQRKFIAVDIDPDKTRAYGVDLNALLQRLRADNFRSPAGKVVVQGDREQSGLQREVYVVADSRFIGLEEVENLPVRPGLRLCDITRPRIGPDGVRMDKGVYETYGVSDYVRVNGRWGATAMIFKTGDANAVDVGERIHEAVTALRANPELQGFEIVEAWSQGDAIKTSIQDLLASLLWGGVLAFVVLLVFLKSWRLSLAIALSIPLCMLLTLAVMYLYGETINLLALMGFTLAGGMLLDNAIVVAENVYRRHTLGEAPMAAAIRGAGEVGLALVLATSTTVIVFISVVFLTDEPFIAFVMGKIGLPVCVSLGFSILVALAVVPMTMNTARLLSGTGSNRARRWFVGLRTRLVGLWRRGWLLRLPALGGLALWEAAAVVLGRNAEGLPATPLADLTGRLYARFVALLLPARWVAGPGLVVVSLIGSAFFFGALERTDQNQGNRDRIQLSVGFPGGSDIAVARHALQVVSIAPGSAAEKAGLRVGDFILRYNNRPVGSLDELRRLEAQVVAGAAIGLEVARGTATGNLDIAGGPTGIEGAMMDTQPLRDSIWTRYVFEVEEILLGVPGADEKRRNAMAAYGITEEEALRQYGRTPEEAREYFGLTTLSCSFNERRARMWAYLDKDRVDQAGTFYTRITEALPERAGMDVAGEFQGGSSSTSEVEVRVNGPDTERLLLLADEVALRLENVPGLEGVRVDTDEGLDEVTVAVERERAAAFGVSAGTLSQVLAFQLSGTSLRDYQQGENMLPLRVRFAPPTDAAGNARDPELGDIAETRIPVAGGGAIAAKAVTATSGLAKGGLGEIRRRNRQTSLRIVGTTSTDDLDRIRRQVDTVLEGVRMPPGYSRQLGGRFGDFQARFGELFTSLYWAGLLVFLVMCFLFESFLKPVCILVASVPGAMLGGFGLLWVTGTPFDIIVGLGIMVLVGVVVNNGIVLVDLVNRLRAEGVARDTAVLESCRQRLRPILLTTLTTVFGLVPMAVGNATFVGTPYFPLGRVVLGGMLASMFFTLVLVPLLYLVLDDVGAAATTWVRRIFGRRGSGEAEVSPAPASPQ